MLDRTSDDSYRELNKKFSGKTAHLEFVDGRRQKVRYIHAAADSFTWFDSKTEASVTVPTTKIRSIYSRDHTKGLLQGMGIGLLTGLFATIIMMASKSNDTTSHDAVEEGIETVGTMAPTVFGWLFGTFIGALAGDLQIYKLASPEEIPQQKSQKHSQPRTEAQSRNQ